MSEAKVFTVGDDEPDVRPGTLAVVNAGDYRTQEVWVASGSNIGNWYCLGSEHWLVDDVVAFTRGKRHPTWRDVVARGPVTLMVASRDDAYRQGWDDGRSRMLAQMESLRYDE